MEMHRCRQVILTLAFSLLVLCVTNQFGGFVTEELGKLILLLIIAALILFIVNRSSALRRLLAVCLVDLAGLPFTLILYCGFIRRTTSLAVVANVLVLPFRFQRPPPILSL
jgi:hypothetical protein